MNGSFWDTLPRPIIGLAPMYGITDHPYRHIQKKYGNPMVVFTEFVQVEELSAGVRRALNTLRYDESQRPIVAQVFGRTPSYFRRAAMVIAALGFDGIDINMGCPTKSVAQKGAGAALIRTPALAREIIDATRAGIHDWVAGAGLREGARLPAVAADQVEARRLELPPAYQQRRSIPVSVKTRIGYDVPETDAWIPHLLDARPAVISLHGRTLRQRYAGEAQWEQIARAAEFARAAGVPILGNGDIQSIGDAYKRIAATGVDGVLIGRASYGNPFVFCADELHAPQPGPDQLLEIALEHAHVFADCFGAKERYPFVTMRKHLIWYARNAPDGVELRQALLQVNDVHAVEDVLLRYRQHVLRDALPVT